MKTGKYSRPLFGATPDRIDVARAARIVADALLIGHAEAARLHGIGVGSIDRIQRIRESGLNADLDGAIQRELCATPQNLTTRARVEAWCRRPLGETSVTVAEDLGPVVLEVGR